MATAVYPGSFDPTHIGHLDVARRATRIFDRLIFAVNTGVSPKSRLFTPEERVALARAALADLPNVVVDSYNGLTVDYARRVGAVALVHGIRTVSDLEYESTRAHMNSALAPQIESVFFMTSPEYAFISSSLIKDVVMNGGDVSGMVPAQIEQALRQRFAARG